MICLRLAICDDEPDCLRQYRGLLERVFEDNGISVLISLFSNCKELMFAMEDDAESIDLVFLDINMPEMNGIEMARWIRDKQFHCEIVFLTVSQEHMLQAFDVGAFHYIVKDVTPKKKMEEICIKAANAVSRSKSEVITVSCAGESRVIQVQDILYFEVRNYIIIVHYSGSESFEFYSTLGKIENNLTGRGFVRSHRSFLVNTRHIQSILRQELKLSNGATIPVGRKYSEELRRHVQQRSGAVIGNQQSAPSSAKTVSNKA